jgi:hypothetical protein
MASCANITLERIRARVSFGSPEDVSSPKFETPDVKSFTVTKGRGNLSAQFSASIEIPSDFAIPAGEDIVIEAGTEGNLRRIFTGRVLSVTVNPSFEDASSYVVNLSGQDRFYELEGKNISRRQRARGLSSFAAITSVTSKAPQKGISLEKRSSSGGSGQITNPDTNIREHSKLVRTDRVAWDPFNPAKDPENLEDRTGGSTGQSTIDIKPKAVSLSPGVSVRFNVEGTTYVAGDTWSVSDPQIGTIQDQQNGFAIYTQRALGENTIIFLKAGADTGSVFTGKATATGIPIHDHSSLGQGGPAHGVYGSE